MTSHRECMERSGISARTDNFALCEQSTRENIIGSLEQDKRFKEKYERIKQRAYK